MFLFGIFLSLYGENWNCVDKSYLSRHPTDVSNSLSFRVVLLTGSTLNTLILITLTYPSHIDVQGFLG
jgi:hypothetical protein